ncbi:MAG: hypothetical protein HOG05_08135 [Bacteroidetes bacterium]|jgi:hypothetical protein|nr:hypothetical protein [Bacteroidota bacterium]MBT5531127.1 hypothetical protein [Cytophagia bacterium]MBT3422428.1 hypothetical protein [Bacteroidota bacterium]MBT3801105.1 hypothetical protein [Bacteroidota bacterium]MBT3932893.1 hypothetical protein [Bacteroidota bacterium]
MSLLNNIHEVFSNREIALIAWLFIALVVVLFTKARNSLIAVFKMLFKKIFVIIYLLISLYLFAIILVLKNFALWDIANLKDILFWLFSVGLILVFKINAAKDSSYFKKLFFTALQWTILLEFIVNLYSFSFLSEFFLLLILVIVGTLQAFADLDEKNQIVSKFLQIIFAVAGFMIFSYSLYRTIQNFEQVLNFPNLISFLLPSTITVLFIPFLYLLALYSTYESYFVRLDFMTNNNDQGKRTKKLILRTALLNLNKLIRITQRLEKRAFYEDMNLKLYITQISKKNWAV